MPRPSMYRHHTSAAFLVVLLSACASTRQSEAPPATAATEPEFVPVIEKDRQMPLTRESPSPDPEHPAPGAQPAAAPAK